MWARQLASRVADIARQHDVPAIVAVPLNRRPDYRHNAHRPMLADLGPWEELLAVAEASLALYRDEYYFKEESVATGVAEIIVNLNRRGPTSTVRVAFDHARAWFSQLAGKEDGDGSYRDV